MPKWKGARAQETAPYERLDWEGGQRRDNTQRGQAGVKTSRGGRELKEAQRRVFG